MFWEKLKSVIALEAEAEAREDVCDDVIEDGCKTIFDMWSKKEVLTIEDCDDILDILNDIEHCVKEFSSGGAPFSWKRPKWKTCDEIIKNGCKYIVDKWRESERFMPAEMRDAVLSIIHDMRRCIKKACKSREYRFKPLTE